MTTLVIGASENPDRYSYKAVQLLYNTKKDVIAFGRNLGNIDNIQIVNVWNENWDIHTVSLYIGRELQTGFYKKIIELKPKRVIFNPGTENEEFYKLLKNNDIYYEEACTLVLINTGQF